MDGWSDVELAAAIDAYRVMARWHAAGQPYNKREVYRSLQSQYGRTEGAFEYRMQNISAVLQEIGQEWLPGLKPAGNVGANVKERIVALLGRSARADPTQSPEPASEVASSSKRSTRTTVYDRDPDIARKVKQRASDGRCEFCGELGFETEAGGYYLEAHHVVPLSCAGPDAIWNVVAICSNDHRRAHFARERTIVRDRLIVVLGMHYPDRFEQLKGLAREMDEMPNLTERLETDTVT